MHQRLQPLDSRFRGNDGENAFALTVGQFGLTKWLRVSIELSLWKRAGLFGCHCEERSDVAISLRLSTCRGTIIATATRLPRCARNDSRPVWFDKVVTREYRTEPVEARRVIRNSSELRGFEQLTAGGQWVETLHAPSAE